MKIVITQDLIDIINDVKEQNKTLKLVRQKKKKWLYLILPVCIVIDLALKPKIEGIIFQLLFYPTMDLLDFAATNKAITLHNMRSLQMIANQLRNADINTDYDLLLEAEMYDKKYTFRFNEQKLPEVLEQKYILVPTYTYNEGLKDISLVQEHVIGSRQYVLSLGSPQKKISLAYSGG